MSYKLNYKNLHLNELQDALKNIDEKENPEEAQYICELIKKGGYQYPRKIEYKSSEITSKYFKWTLILLMSVFLVINAFNLIKYQLPKTLIPMLIQTTILFMIIHQHKYLRMLVMLWSFLLIFSGFLGVFLISMHLDNIDTNKLFDKSFNLIVGILLFWLSGKFIILNEKSSNK